MKYDKLKQLVGNSVAISPHPTMGMKVVEPVPVKAVSAKSVPVKAVSAKSVPVKAVPGKSVPVNTVPTKPVPINTVPTKPVPINTVPTKPVPTNSVPINTVPTKPVPTNSVPVTTKPVPVNTVPTKPVPTNSVPTNYVPTFKSTDYQSFTNDIKTLITSIEVDNSIDEVVFKSLSKVDKLVYLATRGWRLSIEMRGNKAYDYAVKYINRKKFRIYLGKTEI
jgi:hypothetical protein